MSRAAIAQNNSASAPELKAEVRRWWNARPCGSTVSGAAVGTREFFDEVERHRYAQEDHLLQFVNFPRWNGKEVLEIGCGMGTDSLQFARGGARFTGVDLTSNAIDITRSRFALYGFQGEFRVADAEELPFADASFDLVYSHGVLHHTPDTQKAIDEVFRVLKPGGTAMVMLYHRHSFNYLVNILIMRRIAFRMIRRGFPVERLSRLTGIDSDLLRQYEAVVKSKPEWTLQDLLNNNTDGPGNPLSKVYSRAQACALFHRFSQVKTHVYWLVSKNLPLIGPRLPRPVDRLLGRIAGWDLHIVAVK